MVFRDWLLSMFSRFLLSYLVSVLFFFFNLWLDNIALYGQPTSCPPVGGHWGGFCSSATANGAAGTLHALPGADLGAHE